MRLKNLTKKQKMFLRITLIISLMLIGIGSVTKSQASAVLMGAGGLVGVVGIGAVFIWAIQLFIISIASILQAVINFILQDTAGGNNHSALVNILFNRNNLTTAGYFSNFGDIGLGRTWGGTMASVADKVTEYYYLMRNLAIALLLFVLLYIGIRMAISTVSDQAKYKKMITNWAVSMALVFTLHYIMIFAFYVNNTLVNMLYQQVNGSFSFDMSQIATQALYPVGGMGEAIIYCMIIGMEFTFLFTYIKRTITLGFLIIIAPLITITYSIDKIGDGRSQALDSWMKEFIYNILIQPFHCILYLVLVQTVLSGMSGSSNLGDFIVYFIILKFMKDAEKIVMKIFGIRADSMPGAASMGVLAVGVATTLGNLGKGAAKAGGGFGKAGSGDLKVMESPSQAAETAKKEAEKHDKAVATQAAKDADKAAKRESAAQAKMRKEAKRRSENSGRPEADILAELQQRRAQEEAAKERLKNAREARERAKKAQRDAKYAGSKRNIKNVAKGAANGFKGGARFFAGGADGTKDIIKHFTKNAGRAAMATAAAAMALGGMGDEKAAVGMGLAALNATSAIDGAIKSHKNNMIMEQNEDMYKSNYMEYIKERSAIDGLDEETIRNQLIGLMEDADKGKVNYSDVSTDAKVRELTRDFIEGSYGSLKDTYKKTGADDAGEMARSFTTNKASPEYRKKNK